MKEWKELYNQHGDQSSVYQSWEWAELNKARGYEPRFITIEENNKLKAGLLYFHQKKWKRTILFAEGSPLAPDQETAKQVLAKFKQTVKKQWGILAPTVTQSTEAYKQPKFYERDSHTIIINLKQLEEELFKAAEKKSIRWGIKRAEELGVKVSEIKTEKELEEFYTIYKETCKRGKLTPKPWIFFQQIHKELEKQGKSKFLIAKVQNKIVGGMLALFSTTHAIVHLTGTNEEGMKNQANVLVYWSMIKEAKKQNKEFIDLGGYDPFAKPGEKSYQINQFKERWGGTVVPQPIFTTSKSYYILKGIIQKTQWLRTLYQRIR